MLKNDYRRSLILLRSNAGGYSGHVRLEKRTMTGSLYFIVQSPQTEKRLEAALVGRSRCGGYYACPLGALKQDGRGQAVLSYTFDPRDICARELEDYALVAVSEVTDTECAVVLFGNLDGHTEFDWRQAKPALCSLYVSAPDEPPLPQARSAEAIEEPIMEPIEEAIMEPIEEPIAEPALETESAGARLGLDMDVPWQETVEALREMFRTNPPAQPCPNDGFVYISAPMPADSGYAEVLTGILAENGEPAAVSYALPAAWTEEPPAGLEGYVWEGDQNRGWWTSKCDLRTGTPL